MKKLTIVTLVLALLGGFFAFGGVTASLADPAKIVFLFSTSAWSLLFLYGLFVGHGKRLVD